MTDARADAFLSLIRRASRGRLKVYLGYVPGVGKTALMLQEGHRLAQDGIDVVIAWVETHGRAFTEQLTEGLPRIPPRTTRYHGIDLPEMDLDAVLARRPQVALVDELAHTNAPGGRNQKRYEDVLELLAAGIHVISTVNIQHLESLYDTVERLTGVKVRERIPDAVLAQADQVVNVDLAPDDLQRRLERGEIYPADRVPAAMAHFFQPTNLEHLRELTLRELAARIDARRRDVRTEGDPGAPDQVMCCLSSRGPNSARLLRYASRLAGRLNRTWYAVYVQTPSEDPLAIDAATQRILAETLTLAHQLGATVFTYKGTDVAQTLLRFAAEYRVGHIVLGKPRLEPWWRRLWRRPVAQRLLWHAPGLTLVVVDVEREVPIPVLPEREPVLVAGDTPASAPPEPRHGPRLADLVTPERIVVWSEPLTRAEALERLGTLAAASLGLDPQRVHAAIAEREAVGSTFLTEGIAVPHARLAGVDQPLVAMGLPRGGLLDAGPVPIQIVVLILLPPGQPGLAVLGAVGRVLRDRALRRVLERLERPSDLWQALASAESA